MNFARDEEMGEKIERYTKTAASSDDIRLQLMISEIEETMRDVEHRALIAKQKRQQPQVDYSWLIDRPKTQLTFEDRMAIADICRRLKRVREWKQAQAALRMAAKDFADVRQILPTFRAIVTEIESQRQPSIGLFAWMGNILKGKTNVQNSVASVTRTNSLPGGGGHEHESLDMIGLDLNNRSHSAAGNGQTGNNDTMAVNPVDYNFHNLV